MDQNKLKELKNNSSIKYIYKIPCNSDLEFEYIVIGDIETKIENNVRYFSYDDWYSRSLSGSILNYVCDTLPKKFKIKTFVSLYTKPDFLKFRKYVLTSNVEKTELHQESFWAIQLLKEGKIYDYKVPESNQIPIFLKEVYGMYKKHINDEHKM